jgi:5-oxoprolinase (ATP-hydrolysing) subunit A
MAEPLRVDLNCDLGESYGRYHLGEDATMMTLITSVNIACGFHAGDANVIFRTVSLAKQHGVLIGAHPGYPDLQGFGRRQMALTAGELTNILYYQLGALDAFTRVLGGSLVHVKPHGALYNLAAQDSTTANVIAEAVLAFNPGLTLIGLAGSALTRAGEAAGLQVAGEGFPDRVYLPDGRLLPRSQPGAVVTDPESVAGNALRLVKEGINVDGVDVRIDTLCLHGDNPRAVENAQFVRQVLSGEGVEICGLPQVLAG